MNLQFLVTIFKSDLLSELELLLDDLEEHPTKINAADKTTAINENTFFINKKSPLLLYILYLNNTTLSSKYQHFIYFSNIFFYKVRV